MVGVWRHYDPNTRELRYTIVFAPDRRYWTEPASTPEAPGPAGRWAIQGDSILFDFDDNPVRRAFRPVARFLGLRTSVVQSYPIKIMTDRLEVTGADDLPHVWTRAPAD
ncbi:MAG TPA: hypothetical protein VGF55_31620 [Gemmataceae bacterium]